jgi:hypothetical protein
MQDTAAQSRTSPPEVIQRYLVARDARDTEGALATFSPDAKVNDEDHDYHGTEEIRVWLDTAAAEFTFTRTLLNTETADGNTWVLRNRLEGDFPGGLVDLDFRIVLRHGLIGELVIA